jgi:hypothetical protein
VRNLRTDSGVSRGRAQMWSVGRSQEGGEVLVSGVCAEGEKRVRRMGVAGWSER